MHEEFKHAGLWCIVRYHHAGYWVGYVGVPKSHPLAGEYGREIEIGAPISWSGNYLPFFGAHDPVFWWFGFDCADEPDCNKAKARKYTKALAEYLSRFSSRNEANVDMKTFQEWVNDENVYCYFDIETAMANALFVTEEEANGAKLPRPTGRYIDPTDHDNKALLYRVTPQAITKAIISAWEDGYRGGPPPQTLAHALAYIVEAADDEE